MKENLQEENNRLIDFQSLKTTNQIKYSLLSLKLFHF